jgi:hypothetical protein
MPAASRPVRALWIVVGSVFTVATLGWGTLQAVAGVAHEERDERTVIDAAVRVLDIEAAGSVTVIGAGRPGTVTVDEHISDGLQKPDRSIRTEGDRLVVRGTCGAFVSTWCGVDFTVQVPDDVRVVISADGNVRVRGITGGTEVTAHGGDIEVRDTRGAMRLSSQGGSISGRALEASRVDASSFGGNISLAFAAPPRRVDADSQGGDVDLVLPDDTVTYRVDTSASGGSAETLVRTDPDSGRTIRARSFGGDVSVRSADLREVEF